MALIFVEPAPNVLATYQQSLLDLMGPHPSAVQTYHLPVGTIGLKEVASGAKLADLVDSGCRFLASFPDGTRTSSEMTNPSFYGKAAFRNFIISGLADVAFARIAQAQTLDAVQDQDYELHFLSIPAIYLEALHLVCQGKGSDLILPLVSVDPQLGSESVCDEATFLAIARSNATTRIRAASVDSLSS